MFGMSQQQQVALIQQMAQLQLMNGMQKTPNNLAGGKLQKIRDQSLADMRPKACRNFINVRFQIRSRKNSRKQTQTRAYIQTLVRFRRVTFKCKM